MWHKKKYKVTIEDESKLEKMLQFKASAFLYFFISTVIIIFLLCVGAAIMAFSPIKKILPGYLEDSKRYETEEKYMRLDSLIEIYENNKAFVDNIMNVLNLEDSLSLRKEPYPIVDKAEISDTLIGISDIEKQFMSEVKERERYNADYYAPIAAENLYFIPVDEQSIISEDSKNSTKARIVLGADASVGAIADGIVLTLSSSFSSKEKNSIILQHQKGFVSRYSGLDGLLVKSGDRIRAGQAIGVLNNNRNIYLELWHNGNSLKPAEYIYKEVETEKTPVIDEEVGRGRL